MPDHTASCSGFCATVFVAEADLVKILERGSIPVLQLNTKDGRVAAHPIRSEEGLSYVAISHVW